MKDIAPPLNPRYELSEHNPEQKFNFIHNPKCAGRSIIQFINSDGNVIRKHINKIGHQYSDFSEEKKSIVPNKIVVIRNPIDRFCSAMRQLKKKKYLDNEFYDIAENADICRSEFFAQIIMGKPHEHRARTLSSPMFRNPERKQYAKMSDSDSLSVNHNLVSWGLVPQSKFVDNPTAVILFENLEKEFNHLLSKANIDVKFDVKVNVSRKNLMGLSDNLLSEESIDFLENNFYNEDVEMYRHFSGLSIDERMNF